jgi:hypothetical protein
VAQQLLSAFKISAPKRLILEGNGKDAISAKLGRHIPGHLKKLFYAVK